MLMWSHLNSPLRLTMLSPSWSRPVGKHLARAWHEETLMLVSAQQLYGKADANELIN